MGGSTIPSYNSSTSPTTPARAPRRASQESATAPRTVPASPEDLLTGSVPRASESAVSSGGISLSEEDCHVLILKIFSAEYPSVAEQ